MQNMAKLKKKYCSRPKKKLNKMRAAFLLLFKFLRVVVCFFFFLAIDCPCLLRISIHFYYLKSLSFIPHTTMQKKIKKKKLFKSNKYGETSVYTHCAVTKQPKSQENLLALSAPPSLCSLNCAHTGEWVVFFVLASFVLNIKKSLKTRRELAISKQAYSH